jgi:hypothetical protein
MVYKVAGGAPAIEAVNGVDVTMYGLNLNTQFDTNGDQKKYYPTIRVIKWKNSYDAVFNQIGTDDYGGDFLPALGWGSPVLSIPTIVTKYVSGTKMGQDWIRKLTEITYAYLKYGKPAKHLSTPDTVEVDAVYAKAVADGDAMARYFYLNERAGELSLELRKSAFQGYLY